MHEIVSVQHRIWLFIGSYMCSTEFGYAWDEEEEEETLFVNGMVTAGAV